MDPEPNDNKDSLLSLPCFSKIAFNPIIAEEADYFNAKIVIFSKQMSDEQFDLACEWAGKTQTPIYCIQRDVERLKKEGFYDYRFHSLRHYQRYRMKAGAIDFFPVYEEKRFPFLSFKKEALSFHVYFQPDSAQKIMVLDNCQLSLEDAYVYRDLGAKFYVEAKTGPEADWTRAEALLESKVNLLAEVKKTKDGVYYWDKKSILQEAVASKKSLKELAEQKNG